MKNILWIILENFEPILGGLFFVFLCLLTGQFGWALVIGGVMTLVAAVAIVLIYWKDYKRRNSRQNDFKKWTRGK